MKKWWEQVKREYRNDEHFHVTDRCSKVEWVWTVKGEHLLSTPSWTLSARLEPERLVESPNYGVFHPGHVTPNPPWACLSLDRPWCCQTRLHVSYCPKHTHTDRIREKNGARQGLKKTHIACTRWKPRTPHVTSSWLNWEWEKRDGEGGSYNLFSVCDCFSIRSYYSSPPSHTENWSPVGQS